MKHDGVMVKTPGIIALFGGFGVGIWKNRGLGKANTAGRDAQVVLGILAPTGLTFAMDSCQKSRFAPLEAADSKGNLELLDSRGAPAGAKQGSWDGWDPSWRLEWGRSCLWPTGYLWLLGEHKIQLRALRLGIPTGEWGWS